MYLFGTLKETVAGWSLGSFCRTHHHVFLPSLHSTHVSLLNFPPFNGHIRATLSLYKLNIQVWEFCRISPLSPLWDPVPQLFSLGSVSMNPSTDDLGSQVVTNTLQQIKSPAASIDTICCVIYLGELIEQCEAQPCQHNNFDYICLITWLGQQATCPLCKTEVHELRYELSEDGMEGKIYKVPQRPARLHTTNDHEEDGFSTSYSQLETQAQHYEDEAIRRRCPV